MQGDERVRHCTDCSLDVYNFSAMTESQIQRILVATNGRLCARWYRRSDGTIITANCPVGFRARVRKISLFAGTALSALFAMSPAVAQTSGNASNSTSKAEKSEIRGGIIVVRVADQTGAVIPQAQVIVLNSANQTVFEGQTDGRGEFQTPGLKSGLYSVEVAFLGFERFKIDAIVVEPNKKGETKVEMQLSVAPTLGVVVDGGGRLEPEGSGDSPILLPLAPAPAAAPVPKPTTIQRLISKIKGNTN